MLECASARHARGSDPSRSAHRSHQSPLIAESLVACRPPCVIEKMVLEEPSGGASTPVALEDKDKACSIKSKPEMMEKKEKMCELVEYDALPEYLKDNEYILGYYRCEWPLKQTILSVFSIHNETLNVWTHFIGFLIFLSLTVMAAAMMMMGGDICPSVQEELQSCRSTTEEATVAAVAAPTLSGWHLVELLANCLPERFSLANNLTSSCVLTSVRDDMANMISPLLAKPATRWPFFAFLCGAMLCLLTSSVCHLVSCHSEQTAYVMLRLDYAGISALIVTSSYPLVYYSFMCQPFFCSLYMGFITVFGVATVLASLVPAFQTAEFRNARALLFFCMGASGLVPIMHKLVAFGDRPEAVISTGYELLMGTFYGLGVVVYAARVPERWMPGKFDIVGHSHQLFHVLVIAGAYTHYLAALQYLQWRDSEGCY